MKKTTLKLIVFEGGEGSGKSTQAKLIYQKLKKENFNVILLREPGATIVSEKIRNILLKHKDIKIHPLGELLLYQASRVQLIYEKIIPAKKENKIIICDRFFYSTIAYQGFGRNLGIQFVENFLQLTSLNISPTITFYFDLPPEIGLKRIKKAPDRLEKENLKFHRKVRKGFLALVKKYPEKIIKLKALKDIKTLHNEIYSKVKKLLT